VHRTRIFDCARLIPDGDDSPRPAVSITAESAPGDPGRRRLNRGLLLRDWSWALAAVAVAALPAAHAGLVDATAVAFALLLPVTLPAIRAQWPAAFGFVGLCIVWAAAQLLSDYVNTGRVMGSSVLLPLLLAVAVAGLAWAHDAGPDKYPILLAVLFAAILVAELYKFRHTLRLEPSAAWKFGFGVPVTLLVVLASCRARRRLVPLFALVCLAAANGLLGYRGYGAFCLIAATVVVVRELAPRAPRSVVFGAALAGVAVLTVAALSYGRLAGSGVLGSAQQYREQQQGHLSPVARVLVTRPYTVGSVIAIEHSPVLGLGSHPVVSPQLGQSAYDALARLGHVSGPAGTEQFLGRDLDSHSLLLGAFVTSGILGTLPWIAVLAVACSVFRRRPAEEHRWLEPLLLVWTVATVWDVLFSPWSTHVELFIAAWLTLALSLSRGRDLPSD